MSWAVVSGYTVKAATVIDADVSTFTGASDKVLRISGRPDWILDLNFQRGPDASLPQRAHLYNALLENRHDLMVRSVVVLLTPEAQLSAINGRYVRQFPGSPLHLVFTYDIVRVWLLPVESFCEELSRWKSP